MTGRTIAVIEMTLVSDAAARLNGQDRVDSAPRRNPESIALLEHNVAAANGNAVPGPDTEAQTSPNKKKESAVCRLKEELSEKVCDIVPLWAVLLLIFITIIVLIFLALFLCTVIYEDVDEKYDPTQFGMLRNFSGSFRLPNFNFTEELLNLTSNGSPSLTAELENKLDGLFRDSPALGRYFSRSQIYHYSDGPVTALFRLMFRMPEEKEEEEGGQLTHFTLSWEMIYNVLRQFLYDQEVDPSDHTYIEPASLNISSVVTNRKDCHCL